MAWRWLSLHSATLLTFQCETLEQARIGLLGRYEISEGEALLLPVTEGLHTIGMLVTIDVAWLSDWPGRPDANLPVTPLDRLVLRAQRRVLPGRLLAKPAGATHALELRGGWLERHPVH